MRLLCCEEEELVVVLALSVKGGNEVCVCVLSFVLCGVIAGVSLVCCGAWYCVCFCYCVYVLYV